MVEPQLIFLEVMVQLVSVVRTRGVLVLSMRVVSFPKIRDPFPALLTLTEKIGVVVWKFWEAFPPTPRPINP